MKNAIYLTIGVVIIIAAGAWWLFGTRVDVPSTTFEECVAAGNPVMESYPRQCRDGSNTFVEFIGNELEKSDLIRINTPRPNQVVSSPLTITGEARGGWFFEASFPVFLTDWDGRIIAQGIATAKGDWMTSEFVPFESVLTFTVDPNVYSNRGSLILKKDNPSGLPQNDDALEIPVIISGATASPQACDADAKICPDGSAVGRTGPKCEFATCPTSPSTTLHAAMGQTVTSDKVSLTPLNIISDSRCPVDVQCIWAGTVQLKVRIQHGAGMDEVAMELGKPITAEGKTITLTEVGPAPHSGESISASSYTFTFEVKN